MPTVNELLEIAIRETENINVGEVFLIRDLFKGYEWNRVSKSNRLLLGTLYLNYVRSKSQNVMPIEKTSSGQQRYTVISEQYE